MSVELATAYVSLSVSTRGLGKDIAKQFGDVDTMADKTGKSAGSRMSSAMGKALKVGGAAVAAAGIATLGTALVKGFQRLDALDQATAKLRGLGHSAGTVDAIMQNALASVKGTAFGMDEAATTAAGAVAAGIKPGKDLERTLTLVADAATIAGTDMSSMGSIINKVATSDMMQMDVANQLMDAGIPILQMVADTLGVTAEEARKMASAGEISFATFQEALESGVGGAAQESGKTFQGAMKNVMAALGRIGANLLSGIFPMVTSGLGTIQAALAPLEDAAKVVGEAIGQFLQNALTMWTAVKGVFDEVFGSGPAAEALAGAMVAADAAAKPFAETMAAINEALEGAVMQARLAALRDILIQVKAAYDVAAEGVGVFLQALTGGSEVGEFEGVMGVLNDIGSEVFAKFLEVKDVVGEVLGVISDAFGPVIAQLGEQFGPILADLIPQIVGIVQNLSPMSLIFQALKPILPLIVDLFATLVETLGGTLATVIPVVVDVLGTLGEIFAGAIVPIITELVSILLPMFLSLFKTILPVVATIAQAILPALASVFGTIVPILAELVKALLPPLASLFDAIAPLIGVVVGVIGDLIKLLVPILVPIINVLVKILGAVLVPVFKVVGWIIEKIVVPIIGALVKAITWVADKFSGFSDTVGKVIGWVKDTISRGLGFVVDLFMNWTLLGVIIRYWDDIKGGIGRAWDSITDGVRNFISGVGRVMEGIKNALSRPIDWVIRNVLNPFLNAIRKVLDAVGLGDLAKKIPRIHTTQTAAVAAGTAGALGAFHAGGWTGPGGKYQPAGIVHADEFVISKAARKSFEDKFPGFLHHINATGDMPDFHGYASGGRVRPVPQGHSGWNGGYYRGSGRWHGGVDYPAPMGTPVRSAAAGVVTTANRWFHSYGHHVGVQHGGGWSTLYAHLSRINVLVGQLLSAGQVLGAVGSTGNSTGPHLHFEARTGGRQVNPDGFLRGAAGLPGGAMSGTATATSAFDIGAMLREAVASYLTKKAPGGGFIGDFLNAIPERILDGVIDTAKDLLGFQGGGVMPFDGPAALSEDGRPELVVGPQVRNLNRGSRVYNADETEGVMRQAARDELAHLLRDGVLVDIDNGRMYVRREIAAHERESVTSLGHKGVRVS